MSQANQHELRDDIRFNILANECTEVWTECMNEEAARVRLVLVFCTTVRLVSGGSFNQRLI